MGLGRAEKGPFGPFSAFQGPAKAGWAMKGFPKGSQRVPEGFPKGSRRVPEGLGRHPGGFGRHLKAVRIILGSFWGVSGHFGQAL